MMRYQSVSPDYNPLKNGSKSSFRCKEGSKAILSNGSGFRFSNSNGSGSGSRGGDVLLQWGHKKRARLSRTEIRSFTDDSSSSSSIIHRRAGSPFIDTPKLPPLPLPLPHSQPPNDTSTSTRASNLRTKESPGFTNNRIMEDRSGAANGSPFRNLDGGNTITRGVSRSAVTKGSPHLSKKFDKRVRTEEKTNGFLARSVIVACSTITTTTTPVQSVQETVAVTTTNTNVSMAEKANVGVIEWPKIYIALSRKEKEDDFLAMKGTKLPHRPKKRAKNIDTTLQYCFPGMWLSDLTKGRYEVREKKNVKKQTRRGLKGMESDSE